jgi:hypothetical protein
MLIFDILLTTFSLATSTAVERVFSQGRQLLSFTRNRLSASSIRAFLCLGSWGRSNLVLFEDVVSAVKEIRRGSERNLIRTLRWLNSWYFHGH